MNYRHIYHAGNFADVVKHVTLIMMLQSLQRKETPFCFLETHAGIGLYPLQSTQAQKMQEYENGIGQLFFKTDGAIPAEITKYLSIVSKSNSTHKLNYYPGSPLIALNVMRDEDQLILCELHPDDLDTLKTTLRGEINCAIHHTDAYDALKAFIPFKQKRGMVLIDPPFEVTDEFDRIIQSLTIALKHWRAGQFMIWFPIKDSYAVNDFYYALQHLQTPHLIVEFGINKAVEAGKLSRCGLAIINPPWKIKESLEDSVLPFLSKALDANWKVINKTE